MHSRLEQTPLSRDLISPHLDVPRYAHYLASVLSIHSAMESTVFPLLGGELKDLEERRKVPAIRKDLELLGTGVPDASNFLDAAFTPLPAFGIGMLYVSEGSTLGGQYIVKQVNTSLGRQLRGATNFLTVYGSRTGERWKHFLDGLASYWTSSDEEQHQYILKGAVYAFDRVHHIFNTA